MGQASVCTIAERPISKGRMGVLFVLALVLSGCASLPDEYRSLSDGETLGIEGLLGRIENTQVIFIGEIHGTSSTHLLQEEVVRYLHERGKRVVVGLEAFPSSSQEVLNRWVEGFLTPYQFERAYRDVWSIPYDFYGRIFEYARDRRIPLVGINADDALIRAVSLRGLRAVSAEVLAEVKFTDCASDAGYGLILGLSDERAYHRKEYPYFCDGQRLRDSVMAYNIARTVRGSDFTVVVLLGVAHAAKVAVPRMLRNHLDATYTVLLPEDVKYIIRKNPDAEIADYTWY